MPSADLLEADGLLERAGDVRRQAADRAQGLDLQQRRTGGEEGGERQRQAADSARLHGVVTPLSTRRSLEWP